MQTAAPAPRGRMQANHHDPYLSVSLLSEFVFCPRAGVIQHEAKQEEDSEDFRDPLRSALPWSPLRTVYSLGQLNQQLNNAHHAVLWSWIAVAVAIIIGRLWWPVWGLLLVVVPLALLYSTRWCVIFFLRYLPARWAHATIPDPNHPESQPVRWWSLINAGFQPIVSPARFEDEDWRLVGNPWRILIHGNTQIPVWRRRPNRNGNNRLSQQHKARMAAYCHLLEQVTKQVHPDQKIASPYGIVLTGNSYNGVTVPNHPKVRNIFHTGLVEARTSIRLLPSYVPPLPSDTQRRCTGCPHSRQDYSTGQSACGTRFNWTPPTDRPARFRY